MKQLLVLFQESDEQSLCAINDKLWSESQKPNVGAVLCRKLESSFNGVSSGSSFTDLATTQLKMNVDDAVEPKSVLAALRDLFPFCEGFVALKRPEIDEDEYLSEQDANTIVCVVSPI